MTVPASRLHMLEHVLYKDRIDTLKLRIAAGS